MPDLRRQSAVYDDFGGRAAIAGRVADLTGRFDISFYGCVVMLAAAAIAAATLRRPARRQILATATIA